MREGAARRAKAACKKWIVEEDGAEMGWSRREEESMGEKSRSRVLSLVGSRVRREGGVCAMC